MTVQGSSNLDMEHASGRPEDDREEVIGPIKGHVQLYQQQAKRAMP